ncbi:hypothetical protein ACFE04_009580 [Oxalis oulophora]
MGGGTMIRAAAKVATSGVINSGLRGAVHPVPPAEHAVRNASRPFTAMVSSTDVVPAAVERNSVEMVDDWDFVSDVEGGSQSKAAQMPRVVFGPPPTLDETKSATSDLKEAIEQVYLSSPDYKPLKVVPYQFVNGSLAGFDNESSETKTCLLSNQEVVPVSTHAIRAFNLLTENPAAQSVVASIAADQNVWNAVLHNEAFLDYLQSCKISAPTDQKSEGVEDSDIPDMNSYDESRFTQEGEQGDFGDGLKVFFENVKVTVTDMVRNIGDFFQNMFGPSADNDDKSSTSGSIDKTLGASFMALAMMVIVVVMMKRV